MRQLLAVAASLALDMLRHVDGVIRDLLEADKNRLDDLIITILLPSGCLLLLRLLGLHRSLLLWLALTNHVREEVECVLSSALDLARDILSTANNQLLLLNFRSLLSFCDRLSHQVHTSRRLLDLRGRNWCIELDDFWQRGLNKMTLIKFQDIELYQNTFPTTLRELTEVHRTNDDSVDDHE